MSETNLTGTAGSGPDILGGLFPRKEIAAALRKSERSIRNYEAAGMPVVKVGNTRLYDPTAVREWFLNHQTRRDPVRRGRPSKRAA